MKLVTMHIRDWRGHAEASLELAPVTLITGSNGIGKTSVQDALEYALSGRCQHTDDKGSGGRLVRDGAKQAVITLTDAAGATICRSYPPNSLALSWSPGANLTQAQDELEQSMGCSGRKARLSLRVGRFFGLLVKEQQALLTQMLGLEITPERMAAEVARLTSETGTSVDRALRAAGCRTTDSLARIYEACYSHRTTVNREVKAAKLEAERTHAAYQSLDAVPAPPSPDDLDAADAAVLQASLALGEQQQIQSAITRQEYRIAELRKRLSEATDQPVDVPALEARERQFEARIRELQAAREVAEARLVRSREAHVSLRAAEESLRALEPALAGQAVCPWRAGQTCAARADVAALEAEASKIRETIALLQAETAADVAAELQTVRASLQNGERALQQLSRQIAEVRARDIGRLRSDLAQAEDTLAQLQDMAIPPEAAQAALAQARARMSELAAARQAHLDYIALEQASSKAGSRLADVTAEKAALEALVAWSGPNGLRARILSEQLGPFVEELDGICSLWGMSARYAPGPSLEVRAAVGAAWVPWDDLSDSEQLRVGLAHQVAFATLTGLRLVVLDRIEALDAERQRVLFQAGLQLAEGGMVDHIVLLGVGCWCEVPQGVLWHRLSANWRPAWNRTLDRLDRVAVQR